MKYILLISGLFVFLGCSHTGPVEQQPAPKWNIQLSESEQVDFVRPQLAIEGDELIIEGAVKRKKSFTGEVGEKVAIIFASRDGQYLDQVLLTLNPKTVPSDGRPATYSGRYSWIPPADATVHVEMAGDKTIRMMGGPGGNLPLVNPGDFTNTPVAPRQPTRPPQPTAPHPGRTGRGIPGRR